MNINKVFIYSLFGVIGLMVFAVSVLPAAKSYSGLDAPSWARQAVTQACSRGIIDCNLPNPGFDEILNRAAGYQMLTKGFGVWNAAARSPLEDIADSWFSQAASTAYTLGWTTNQRNFFLPNELFTRAQISVALSAILGLPAANSEVLSAYPDYNLVPQWARSGVASMVSAGLIAQGGSNLRPNDAVTKIEAIVILNESVTSALTHAINVLEVSAVRLGVSTSTVTQALNTGKNIVNGELVQAINPRILNGDFCWRDSNGDGIWRRCSNLIINPGLDPDGPIPAVSSWITGTLLDTDRQNNASSRSLRLAGSSFNAVNDEYNEHFYPLYSPGVYDFSFWMKEDSASLSSNDWSVRLKVRDWWDQDNMPQGARRCYVANHSIRRASDAAFGQWKKYSYEFSVPLIESQWDAQLMPLASGCNDSSGNPIAPYDPSTIIPAGYAIVINGSSQNRVNGNIWLDDFALVKKY